MIEISTMRMLSSFRDLLDGEWNPKVIQASADNITALGIEIRVFLNNERTPIMRFTPPLVCSYPIVDEWVYSRGTISFVLPLERATFTDLTEDDIDPPYG